MKYAKHRVKMLILVCWLSLRNWLHWSTRLSKAQLIHSLKTEREELEKVIATFDEGALVESEVPGKWSPKDLMAHLATWDQRGSQWIQVAAQGKIPKMPVAGYTWEDLAELNAQTYLAEKDRPVADVFAEFQQAYQRLLEQVQGLSEKQVRRPLVAELIVWRYGHYRAHRKQLCGK